MYLDLDAALVQKFEKVLSDAPPAGRQKEQVVQDFMEENSELIPTPNLLNHGLHSDLIISKFPLSTALTTDYVYITKSSDRWRITFVELESPEKTFFNADLARASASSKFNGALDQVRSWEIFVRKNEDEVLRRLRPLMYPLPMLRNPIEYNYQLIIGRSDNKNASQERTQYLQRLRERERIEVMSYDSVINWYTQGPRECKNIVRAIGDRFGFKSMHILPENMFAYIGPDVLQLSESEVDRLKAAGYNIDDWKKGKELRFNGKWSTPDKFSDGIKAAIASAIKTD